MSALPRHIHTKNTAVQGSLLRGEPCAFGSDLVVAARDGGVRASSVDGCGTDPGGVRALKRALALLETLPAQSDVHLTDADGRSAIWHSCDTGTAVLTRALLKHGANPNDFDAAGWTCLHAACDHGFATVATILLDAGANLQARTSGPHWSPLHLACSSGHSRTVRLLLERGADHSDLTADGWTSLLLLGSGATANQHVKVAALLLDYGANADVADPVDMETPLHKACRNGQEELATLLLERGAAIVLDKEGVTPLSHALAWGFAWDISVTPRRL